MTSRGEVAVDSSTALRLAALVERHPGRTAAQLAAMVGWGLPHTGKALTAARKGGHVGLLKIGGGARWFSTADMPAVLDQARREQRQRELVAQQGRNLRQVERRSAMAADADGSPDLPDQPIRRRADARAPLPFVCRAPASVFHLGGAL